MKRSEYACTIDLEDEIMERYRGIHILLALMNTLLNSNHIHYKFTSPILGITITLAPVVHGCESMQIPDSSFTETEKTVSVKLAVHQSNDFKIRNVDALVFQDDSLSRLDSYQRFEDVSGTTLEIGSQAGSKTLFICANPQWKKEDWSYIFSSGGLDKMRADLENERSRYPLMTGCIDYKADNSNGTGRHVHLRPLLCNIVLESLSCDFSRKPYRGSSITDIKVYLTNVNATCRITADSSSLPERIINHGGLIQDDLSDFIEPAMIMQSIDRPVSRQVYKSDISLFCYPNNSTEETIGTPFTRLVIEGRIDDEVWYWPINLDIRRNCRYTYRINITGKGSKDPDTPVSTETADIHMTVKEWDEKEEYCVRF